MPTPVGGRVTQRTRDLRTCMDQGLSSSTASNQQSTLTRPPYPSIRKVASSLPVVVVGTPWITGKIRIIHTTGVNHLTKEVVLHIGQNHESLSPPNFTVLRTDDPPLRWKFGAQPRQLFWLLGW